MSTPFGKVLENFGKLPAGEKPQTDARKATARAATPRKVGRPPGKKSNPDYTQVTVYLRKQTHLAAKKRLLDEGREFSKLVEDLVARWIVKKSETPKF